MLNFNTRDPRKEMMDGETDPTILEKNYQEIEKVNIFLGGYSTIVKGIKKLIGEKTTAVVMDVGCGAGDNIAAINRWANRKNLELHFIGVDISPTACSLARERFKSDAHIEIICSDYKKLEIDEKVDIICTSLFNHHLSDEENLSFISWANDHAHLGIAINDLHRHPLAYYSIKWIAFLANTSIYFRNDAPLSVLRAFKKKDWLSYQEELNLKLNISWNWAFRWLVTLHKQ